MAKKQMTYLELAARYGVSVSLISQWRFQAGFPRSACTRKGSQVYWDVARIDQWLRNRPIGQRGYKARWLGVVGHKAA